MMVQEQCQVTSAKIGKNKNKLRPSYNGSLIHLVPNKSISIQMNVHGISYNKISH